MVLFTSWRCNVLLFCFLLKKLFNLVYFLWILFSDNLLFILLLIPIYFLSVFVLLFLYQNNFKLSDYHQRKKDCIRRLELLGAMPVFTFLLHFFENWFLISFCIYFNIYNAFLTSSHYKFYIWRVHGTFSVTEYRGIF